MRHSVRKWASLLILLAAGCGQTESNGRVAVSGTVTHDGVPVPAGQIRFAPAPGASGPSAGAPIEAGRFSIPAGSGPGRGEYKVTVTAGAPPSKRRFGRDSAHDYVTVEFLHQITRPDDQLKFELSLEEASRRE